MNEDITSNFFQLALSYADWTSSVSSTQLADNGFKYTGDADTVQCVSCKVKLSDWRDNDNIAQRHYKASPACKIAQSKFQSNDVSERDFCQINSSNSTIAIGHTADNLINDRESNQLAFIEGGNMGMFQQYRNLPSAQMKQYESEAARLESYDGWPDSSPVKPATLARAGLFYTGIADKVKCPFCLGSMYNWEIGDNPLSEHAKYYNECPFIKFKIYDGLNPTSIPPNAGSRSERCLLSAVNNTGNIEADAMPLVSAASTPIRDPARAANNTSPIPVISTNHTDPGILNHIDFTELNAVKIVSQMGYEIDIITAAVKRIPDYDPLKLKSDVLLDAIFELESEGYDPESEKIVEACPDDSTRGEPEGAVAAADFPADVRLFNKPVESLFSSVNKSGSADSGLNLSSLDFKQSSSLHSSKESLNKESHSQSGSLKFSFSDNTNTQENKLTSSLNSERQQPSNSNSRTASPAMHTNNGSYSSSETQGVVKHKALPSFPDESVAATPPHTAAEPNETAAKSSSPVMDPKYQKLSDEHSQLVKNKVCNMCKKQSVNILFLPCRHLICCETCAAATKSCPQCEKVIIGTVKIYLS